MSHSPSTRELLHNRLVRTILQFIPYLLNFFQWNVDLIFVIFNCLTDIIRPSFTTVKRSVITLWCSKFVQAHCHNSNIYIPFKSSTAHRLRPFICWVCIVKLANISIMHFIQQNALWSDQKWALHFGWLSVHSTKSVEEQIYQQAKWIKSKMHGNMLVNTHVVCPWYMLVNTFSLPKQA